MHEKDALEKNFFAYDEIFAQFWNRLVLRDASHPISSKDLMDAPTEFISVVQGEPIKRTRDILKYYRGKTGLGIALMGLENQTCAEPFMPIRIMGYDWMAYDKQIKSLNSRQKIIPVVTVVLYFGYTQRWRMPITLSECVEMEKPFESCFSDYTIRVIELAWLSDEEIEALTGDLKNLALGLRCFRQRDLEHSPDGVIENPSALLSLLCKITGEPKFDHLREQYQEAEEVNMCEIFEGFREQYRAQGEERGKREGIAIGEARGEERGKREGIAIGEARGEARGKREQSQDIAIKLMDMHMSQEDIAHVTGLSLQEIGDLAQSRGELRA